jgi:hypothetical protein
MKKKLIILVFLFCEMVYSQNSITFNYVLNKCLTKTDSVSYKGIMHEFRTKRVYFNTSTFLETFLFTGSETKSILYKVKKEIWYYKGKKNWQLFYDFNKKKGGYFLEKNYKLRIRFKKTVLLRNVILHKIELEKIGVEWSHTASYYINPFDGVIMINYNNGNIFLRRDCFESPLTDKEVDTL